MQIIAVDDEEGALKMLVKAIRRADTDSQIEAFQLPEDALKYAESHPVDVAFLDIQMPEITGLELTRKLKKIHPFINVIFTTGYSEYAMEAINLRTSGYLMKPVSKEDVERELGQLRFPLQNKEAVHGIYYRTFGNFDMFVDGKPVTFHRELAKEMLAYLVDRRGSSITRKELAAILFEDSDYSRKTQAYLSQIVKSLRESLAEAGVDDIFLTSYNSYAINTSKGRCDAYDYLDGNPEGLNAFHGEYMAQYSWAEYQKDKFY